MISCLHVVCRSCYTIYNDDEFFLLRFRYPVNDEFLSDVRKEVLFQVQRLQSHPSIVLWAGNNENEMFLAGIEKFLTPDDQITARNDYRKLYIETVMGAVVELDPHGSRPFVASSPSNGPESVQENYTAKNPLDPLYGNSLLSIK